MALGTFTPRVTCSLATSLKLRSALEQFEAVNGYVDQTPCQADAMRFGVVDHWATPAEFLGSESEREDYAIAKYRSLRQLAGVLSIFDKNEYRPVLSAHRELEQTPDPTPRI